MADGIVSNLGIAQGHATSLQNALTALSGNWTPDTDKKTTLQGNTKLQTVSTQELAVLASLRSVLEQDIANIHSVSTDFEALDQQLQQNFTLPSLP